jgi:hypothetical protein
MGVQSNGLLTCRISAKDQTATRFAGQYGNGEQTVNL